VVANDNLRDAKAERIREDGRVTVQLAVKVNRFEYLSAICFVAAIEVMQLDAARPSGDTVEKLLRQRL
jgi:hypothetical protein